MEKAPFPFPPKGEGFGQRLAIGFALKGQNDDRQREKND